VPATALLLIAALLPPAPVAAAVGSGGGLTAAAAASGRPPECGSRSKRALARGPTIWELARVPSLQKYCDLMARAQTQLAGLPQEAKKAALEADKALPGHAPPAVVLARAAIALGDVAGAAEAFARARAIDARSVEDPATMVDLARVLARSGKRDEALTVYRAVVPRVDLLGAAALRVSVLLEAAHLSMTVEGAGGAAPSAAELARPKGTPRPRLDEAVAYLREARQRPPTQLAGDVLLSLALTLDRAGERDEAAATLTEAQRNGARRLRDPVEYLATPEDGAALDALAAEGGDRATAHKAWESYLAGPGGKGPWAAAAKARLELIKKGGGRPAPARKGP
jgi:tetratricopeptide (TPR) repeat protein